MYEQATVFTPEELAERWKTNRATIYRMMKDGRLSYFTVGALKRIPQEEVKRVESTIANREEVA